MAQRRRPTPDETDRAPRPSRERVHVKAPPEVASHALSFPWATTLAIGWGAPDRLPSTPAPPAAPAPRRNRGRSK